MKGLSEMTFFDKQLEMLKVCVECADEKSASGFIYHGYAKNRLRFNSVAELITGVKLIRCGLHEKRSLETLFSSKNGFEDFSTYVKMPWNLHFLYTCRGKAGALLLGFDADRIMGKGAVTVIENRCAVFSKGFFTDIELAEIVNSILPVFRLKEQRERDRAFAFMSQECKSRQVNREIRQRG